MSLKVNEIFYSIQGETITSGLPSVFVRLTGCNLDCAYCDTRYARDDGTTMDIETVIQKIEQFPYADHITITGGEPLAQPDVINLMKQIIDRGWKCQIETNGSILLKDVPEKIRKIVDVKTPSSGESDSFDMRNLKYLNDRDEIKFIISDSGDYEFSKDFVSKYHLKKGTIINFSPAFDAMIYQELADRIIADGLPVRLNLQLHKIIWGPDAKGK